MRRHPEMKDLADGEAARELTCVSEASGARSLADLGMTTLTLAVMSPLDGRGVTSFRKSFFFAQFRQDAEILEGRRVAGNVLATGNFLG